MYFTAEKANRYIGDLSEFIYEDRIEIRRFKVFDHDVQGAHRPDFDDSSWADFCVGGVWGGRDKTVWFRTAVDIPATWINNKLALYFIVGAGHEGGLSGSESLLYVNGEIIQGLDENHREVGLVSDQIRSGRLNIAIKAFSGLQTEQRVFRAARLVRINEDAEDLYFRASTVLQAVQSLDPGDYDRESMLMLLNEAINTIDFRKPGSSQFYASIAKANASFVGGCVHTSLETRTSL